MPALRTIHQKATVIDGRIVVEVPKELNGKQLDVTLVEEAEQVTVDQARIEQQLAWLKSFAGKYTGPVDPNETYSREMIYDDDGR
jgi:hypothetical protein